MQVAALLDRFKTVLAANKQIITATGNYSKQSPDQDEQQETVVGANVHGARSFKELDVNEDDSIELLQVHASGWAEGITQAGTRGWFLAESVMPVPDVVSFSDTRGWFLVVSSAQQSNSQTEMIKNPLNSMEKMAAGLLAVIISQALKRLHRQRMMLSCRVFEALALEQSGHCSSCEQDISHLQSASVQKVLHDLRCYCLQDDSAAAALAEWACAAFHEIVKETHNDRRSCRGGSYTQAEEQYIMTAMFETLEKYHQDVGVGAFLLHTYTYGQVTDKPALTEVCLCAAREACKVLASTSSAAKVMQPSLRDETKSPQQVLHR